MRACGSPKDPAKGITDGKRGERGGRGRFTQFRVSRVAHRRPLWPDPFFFLFLFLCDEVA